MQAEARNAFFEPGPGPPLVPYEAGRSFFDASPQLQLRFSLMLAEPL